MKKLALAAIAAVALTSFTPIAGSTIAKADPAQKLAQVGLEIRTDRDREYREHHRDCREVTVRERRGDEVIVRHERRCD